jgi:hypothetical protein
MRSADVRYRELTSAVTEGARCDKGAGRFMAAHFLLYRAEMFLWITQALGRRG